VVSIFTQRITAVYEKIENIKNYFSETPQRIRLIGIILKKFIGEENKYCYFSIDDGTGVIGLRIFDNVETVENIKESDKVLVIGFLKNYNEEVYVQPEFIKKLNPNEFYFHKIIREILTKKEGLTKNINKDAENDEITRLIKLLKENNGMNMESLKENLNIKEEKIKEILKTLMELGDVFEPKKGVYKLV